MERKQKSFESVSEQARREKIIKSKREFRFEQRNLSFNEKMQIAFALNERDAQIKKAVKKKKWKRKNKKVKVKK